MIRRALLIALISLLLASSGCVKPVAIGAHIYPNEACGYFEIENKDSYDWEDVQLTVNRHYACKTISKIPSGFTYIIRDDEFAKPDGTRFSLSTMKPLTFLVECQTPKGRGLYDGVLTGTEGTLLPPSSTSPAVLCRIVAGSCRHKLRSGRV